MSEDASIWRDVLAKSTAVEVIVEKLKDIIRSILQDLPSDNENHAAKYLDVFLSFKASLHCSIIPKRTHAARISPQSPHSLSLFLLLLILVPSHPSLIPSSSPASKFTSVASAPGSQIAAGREKMAHQIPLSPISSLRANVDPRSFSTSTRTTA